MKYLNINAIDKMIAKIEKRVYAFDCYASDAYYFGNEILSMPMYLQSWAKKLDQLRSLKRSLMIFDQEIAYLENTL
ncbi:hypothetical protein [Anaerostipes sp. Marseille-Q3525]|uniref:hypothetical protein n=1 Tax=Anaerostipes sp. Marseille-Q3525 TaxID=2758418 RepID=UPI001BA81226|nr:hypothetical protein [Anaerostipes sp. Marseille-Q3525]MBR9960895.1 hypothetical protein [Anaerostipes sp. Marseille-Q3525]